uniref:Uncharacterized protein n=1 Tax=mine drainage metagenome TaxID=410659 RepID=E6Q4I5_9ZZZZ
MIGIYARKPVAIVDNSACLAWGDGYARWNNTGINVNSRLRRINKFPHSRRIWRDPTSVGDSFAKWRRYHKTADRNQIHNVFRKVVPFDICRKFDYDPIVNGRFGIRRQHGAPLGSTIVDSEFVDTTIRAKARNEIVLQLPSRK